MAKIDHDLVKWLGVTTGSLRATVRGPKIGSRRELMAAGNKRKGKTADRPGASVTNRGSLQ